MPSIGRYSYIVRFEADREWSSYQLHLEKHLFSRGTQQHFRQSQNSNLLSFKMNSSAVVKASGGMPVPMERSSGVPPAPPDNHLLLVDEQKMVDIEKPHHNDVLCGRGVTTNRHPGNESFRSLVGLNKVRIY